MITQSPCNPPCTPGLCKVLAHHGFMKSGWRISVKDYRHSNTPKIQPAQVNVCSSRQFFVKMNGGPWPTNGRPVPITRSPDSGRHGQGSQERPVYSQTATALVAGVFIGSALWWLLLSSGAALFRSRVDSTWLQTVNRVSGVIIIGFGVHSLWSIPWAK